MPKYTKPRKLTRGQRQVLEAIRDLDAAGELGTHALARALKLSGPGGLNATLQRLESEGWITRPEVIVRGKLGLTAKGKRELERED